MAKTWKLFENVHQLGDWLMHYYSVIQWNSVDRRENKVVCVSVKNDLQDNENMLSFVWKGVEKNI